MKPILDEAEVRKAISQIKPDGGVFEIRIVPTVGKNPWTGYFRSADEFLKAFHRDYHERNAVNVYISLNHLKEEIYSRSQSGKLMQYAKNSTSGSDVIGYDWFLIDLDPVRPADTSSSDEQLLTAKAIANNVHRFLKMQGFSDPLCAFSGNGYHLLYRIQLANATTKDKNGQEKNEAKELLKRCLQTLDAFFSTDKVKVDMSNFDPNRVCKLYGTLAQKGSDTSERPHRYSKLISCPVIVPTSKAYLQKLADMYPEKEEKPQSYNGYNPGSFDIGMWLDRYHVRYKKAAYAGGAKFILEQCPFDESHKGHDACIFQGANGSIGFHCFHNSCSGKTWRDVRMLFEPNAYERKQMEYEKRIYATGRNQKAEPPKPKEGVPMFFTALDVLNRPQEEEKYIRTGVAKLDKALRGLRLGGCSVLTGLRASGKSTILGQIGLQCIDSGNTCIYFSGELSDQNFMKWIWLQAAGKNHLRVSSNFDKLYMVPDDIKRKISEWMGEKLHLFNNEHGNNYELVMGAIKRKAVETNASLIVLDNLMAFDISGLSYEKLEAQKKFVWDLHMFAMEQKIHVMFVAHPRKAVGFLRLDDISGSADLSNAVDTALIIHRVNNDFKRAYKDMFGKEDQTLYQATNVIEITKDREGGVQDVFIPLYYEEGTKRLKNEVAENYIYGWDKISDGFIKVPPDDNLFT